MDNPKVTLNKYGFYELTVKPSPKELDEYYSKKYYQENKATYDSKYPDEELKYIKNKIDQKYALLQPYLKNNSQLALLDLGCGEGFALRFFLEKKWEVKGLDYSSFGCMQHNPECLDKVVTGDIYGNLSALQESGEKFDLIWLDNVLEHVLDPFELLNICHKLCKQRSILMIEVPNDFSRLQQSLYDNGLIDKRFWVVVPDHISYFNKEGLTKLCGEAGWHERKVIADFPIDFNLANEKSNYIMDKSNGKSAHKQRVFIDNLMHSISVEKTNAYYEALADLGLGRSIISIFTNY